MKYCFYVRVVAARDVPVMDYGGKSDPFCTVKYGSHKFKTKVIKESLEPVWDEEFLFKDKDYSKNLKITLYDKDFLSRDYIGEVSIPMLELQKNSVIDDWFPLKNREVLNRRRVAEIHLKLRSTRVDMNTIDPQPDAPEAGGPEESLSSFSTEAEGSPTSSATESDSGKPPTRRQSTLQRQDRTNFAQATPKSRSTPLITKSLSCEGDDLPKERCGCFLDKRERHSVIEERFQNQRKSLKWQITSQDIPFIDPPPWSDRDFSKNRAVTPLPQNWKWTDVWKIDKKFGNTEKDNWKTGYLFSQIQQSKQSKTADFMRSCRSRRWIRKRVYIGPPEKCTENTHKYAQERITRQGYLKLPRKQMCYFMLKEVDLYWYEHNPKTSGIDPYESVQGMVVISKNTDIKENLDGRAKSEITIRSCYQTLKLCAENKTEHKQWLKYLQDPIGSLQKDIRREKKIQEQEHDLQKEMEKQKEENKRRHIEEQKLQELKQEDEEYRWSSDGSFSSANYEPYNNYNWKQSKEPDSDILPSRLAPFETQESEIQRREIAKAHGIGYGPTQKKEDDNGEDLEIMRDTLGEHRVCQCIVM